MDFMIERLLGFGLVLTRLSAFFLVVPVFGSTTFPVRIRVAAVVLLSVFFSMSASPGFEASGVSGLEAGIYLCNEATYGFCLGLIASLLFTAVKVSGRIAERQMGLAMAETFDPLSEERGQPLGTLFETIFVLLFLSAGGLHLFLMVIGRSYEIFQAGSTPSIVSMAEGVVEAGSVMLMAGLRLAAPLLAAFLVLMVILAVLARVVPEMNILFVSLPLRVGLGLLMAAIFLPFIQGFVSEFSVWMEKLVVF
jgi:flagellar biosynthetic protein FliR